MLEKHGMKEELAKKAGSIRNGNGRETEEILAAANETERVDGMEEMEKNRGRDSSNAFVRLPRADEIECRVSVINEKGQWIAKQDVGTVSYSEKEKGQASDSFKRACFNWGLGRELYTAPFIWIPAEVANIQKKEKDREQKYYTSDRFRVQAISYDEERAIDFLVVVNAKGQAVYSMDKRKDAMLAKKKAAAAGNMPGNGLGYLSQEQQDTLKRELERTGVTLDTVLARYHLQSPEQIDGETYRKAMKSLKNSKSREAA